MSLCIKSTSSGWFLCTGQTHRKVISFDLQRGRKQSERGAVLGVMIGSRPGIWKRSVQKFHHKTVLPALLNYALNGHPGPCPDKEFLCPVLKNIQMFCLKVSYFFRGSPEIRRLGAGTRPDS